VSATATTNCELKTIIVIEIGILTPAFVKETLSTKR
jgi:hypothetical protein